MEYIGYILQFKEIKQFYCEWELTTNPFEAFFYFDYDLAVKAKNEADNIFNDNVEIIKVKKTIHKIY